MREIKFRVYDEESQSMEYEIAIGKGYGKEHYILFLGLGETFIIEDKLKVMQYTGLKDKNGIEIYEGDIIKVLGNECTIFWQQGAFKFQKNTSDYHIQPLFDFATSGNSIAFEVIGNIYENPELLESNK